jgi:hypothetical protein
VTGRTVYGPDQLADYLGLHKYQFERACLRGLVPARDRSRGWSAAVADELLKRAGEIRAATGSVPDYGAVNMARAMAERLGVAVTRDGVAELARMGLLRVVGDYKGFPVYDGEQAEALTDLAAIATAEWNGHLRTADESAAYLRIRRADFDHLTRAGLLRPADWGHGPYDRRNRWSVPLYRCGDLDGLAARPDLDWAAARQAGKGQRSPFAALPGASAEGAASK